MNINNTFRPNELMQIIQTEMIKKSQDITKNIIGKILEDNFENTQKIQQEVAKITKSGINFDIKA